MTTGTQPENEEAVLISLDGQGVREFRGRDAHFAGTDQRLRFKCKFRLASIRNDLFSGPALLWCQAPPRCLLQAMDEFGTSPWSAEAQSIGEIESTFKPMDLAEFLLASWEGAILRMKVERGPAALERFKRIIFQTVFKEQK
jgi:hypothetical protein